MDPLGVKAYLARDWGLFERSAAAHWAELRSLRGAGELLAIAQRMRQSAQARCGPPTPADRDADLTEHLRLSALLHRVRSGV